MRMMSYRRELDCENGYFIANTDVCCWDVVPTPDNYKAPAIRVSNVPLEDGHIVSDIADYVSLNEFIEDGYVSAEFRENYVAALRGELKGWKLVAVNIRPNTSPYLIFVSDNFEWCEMLYINQAPQLRVMFEVEKENEVFDRYLLEMSDQGHGMHILKVTEYHEHGRYEIVFDGIHGKEKSPNSNWEYVYVTEYR